MAYESAVIDGFSISPTQVGEIRRVYLEEAICLQTVFQNKEAEIVLEDMLAVGANDTGHELGANAPHAIIRRLRCIKGEVDISVEYAPRPEYGLISPVLRKTEKGIRLSEKNQCGNAPFYGRHG